MGFESALLIARGKWVNLNKLTVKTMSFPCVHFVLRHEKPLHFHRCFADVRIGHYSKLPQGQFSR